MSPRRALASGLTTLGLLVLLIVAASDAGAQSSGGSFGSSGFGGGGGSSSSSSSSGGSWGSSSSSGSSSGPSQPRSAADFSPPTPDPGTSYLQSRDADVPEAERDIASPGANTLVGVCSCTGIFAILFAGVLLIIRKIGRPREGGTTPTIEGAFELRRVSIAFDWTARAEIQQALDQMGKTIPMQTDAGRRNAVEAAANLLLARVQAARYASHSTTRHSTTQAEPAFLSATSNLRSRYRQDTRGQHAVGETPEMRARREEGQGLVVVSIVICVMGKLPALPAQIDPQALTSVLLGLNVPHSIRVVAFEVIWSPAEENDRMSSAELENLYPELMRTDSSNAVGRLQCGFCSGVFPAELGNCPGCGAPTPAPSAPEAPPEPPPNPPSGAASS